MQVNFLGTGTTYLTAQDTLLATPQRGGVIAAATIGQSSYPLRNGGTFQLCWRRPDGTTADTWNMTSATTLQNALAHIANNLAAGSGAMTLTSAGVAHTIPAGS